VSVDSGYDGNVYHEKKKEIGTKRRRTKIGTQEGTRYEPNPAALKGGDT
jgi:hypothetical protein